MARLRSFGKRYTAQLAEAIYELIPVAGLLGDIGGIFKTAAEKRKDRTKGWRAFDQYQQNGCRRRRASPGGPDILPGLSSPNRLRALTPQGVEC